MLSLMQSKKNLNIIEVFRSVQGETSLTGLPTTFIRLAACNLRCTWCDTAYSFGRGMPVEIEGLIQTVKENGCKQVCVTGGEPLLQSNVHLLIKELCDLDYVVSIETGGSLSIREIDSRAKVILDIKCPGSGMSGKNFWENIDFLKVTDEVKFVLLDRADYDYAKDVCLKYGLFDKAHILFSPVFNKLEASQLVDWFLKDRLPVRLNLQTHKFIWEPTTRGV